MSGNPYLHRAVGTGHRGHYPQQARSQARVSGVAKFSQRNHVVQNLRAYFMLRVVTIKWMMCVQEKIELTGMSQRPRLSSAKISGEPLLRSCKDKATIKLQESSQGGKKLASWCSGVEFATPCHLMATGLPPNNSPKKYTAVL